ncbi:hypothetical protein BDB01DRAFT_719110 [Pilobolus umbonatus]|nr:hypothetical protein BDB01DRAFT_719110 [Pilobolus umbonatus]
MAPPPYENVIHTSSNQLENKRFGTLQNIWKRASFSASAAFGNDVKVMQPIIHTINKKEVDHAMTLMNVATDMNNSGNQQMAIDLYMMGLDKMISALPLDSDANVRSALEKKLVEVKERHQLSLISLSDLIQENEEAEEDKPLRSQISDLVINAAVLSAVALKKSPIPDALTSVANFAMSTAASVDEKHHIRERTWSIATAGVAKAVEVDRQFEIHQMLTGAMYTGLTAFVKAGIAYQETQAEANFISKRNSMRASASPAF